MAGFIKIDAQRVATTALNTKVDKDVFDKFKIWCKEKGYPLNVVLETFMLQYANGRFPLEHDDIMRLKFEGKDDETLNTTFNKEIYTKFKTTCKANGYFVKHVVMAFMEQYSTGEYIFEFRKI